MLNGDQLIAQRLACRAFSFHFARHFLATRSQLIEQLFVAGIEFAIQLVVFATEGITGGKHSVHNFLALFLPHGAQKRQFVPAGEMIEGFFAWQLSAHASRKSKLPAGPCRAKHGPRFLHKCNQLIPFRQEGRAHCYESA